MSLPTRGTDHRLLDPQLLHHPPPIIHAHVHQHLLLVLLLLLILGGLGCDHGQNCPLAHDLADLALLAMFSMLVTKQVGSSTNLK